MKKNNEANIIQSGTKLVFTNDFKQKIINNTTRDVLFYIKNDVFVVKELKDDKISIDGIAMFGFLPINLFDIYQHEK